VSDLPPLPWLGAREALQVLRIFQEAVSNVVQHAGATAITVRTGERPGADGRAGVFVEVDDDGRGLGHRKDGAGSGLANMNHRAADLGGSVVVNGGPDGTRVVLWLPIDGSRLAV
jgi:signal transduction histidine kinase